MWDRVRPWFFPVSCLGCGAADVALCAACGPQPADGTVDVVANVAVRAAGSYDGLLRRAILAMKQGERAYLDPFAALLSRVVPTGVPVVPLPTSGRRRAGRGFDQAVELARRLAVLRDGTCSEILIKRGIAQRGLDRRQRLAAGGRFAVKRGAALPGLAIVVDDVCTTGATLADGIATLRGAGVAVIGAAVIARTAAGRNSRSPRVVLPDVKAIWNGTVIAESEQTEVVEGNHYFPATAIKREFFRDSSTHSTCPWKGVASYYTVDVNGKTNPDAAWYYPAPKDAAKQIAGHVAFWKGVEVKP